MSEYEDLVAKILEQKADLNRESLNELVKEKKATVGKGYLQDKGALYLIATDLGISLGEPSNDGISIKDIFSGAKDVSLETRVLNVAKPRQFSRKDGSEFLLRTMTVYDNGGTVSVKLWDEKANLPGIENLKPGDLVRIVKAYVKSDLSGAPTINIGSGSSIEPSDSQSDIRGIDSMSVDVGTIKQHEDQGFNVRLYYSDKSPGFRFSMPGRFAFSSHSFTLTVPCRYHIRSLFSKEIHCHLCVKIV